MHAGLLEADLIDSERHVTLAYSMVLPATLHHPATRRSGQRRSRLRPAALISTRRPHHRLPHAIKRGLNTVTVCGYPSCHVRLRVRMPDLHEHVDGLRPWSDPRLGFHHGALISPRTGR
jgi:hypothetical protein